ncbi:Inositolphosphotransferase 1 [Nakaseomyces bracarensis]|uniref:Inositolphosphotransferase 1 n=1 Tax=Nakaseomyces bracarensis TaxID=273131 RepID=A0ABR4NXU2_9SACH
MGVIWNIGWFLKQVVVCGLNQRNLLTLPLNFAMNFSPIFIWLFIFHHAQWIPIDVRPTIHSHVAFYADQYLFGDYWYEFLEQLDDIDLVHWSFVTSSAFLFIALVLLPAALWFYMYVVQRRTLNVYEWYDALMPVHHRKSTWLLPLALPAISWVVLNLGHYFAYQDESNFTKTKDMVAWFFYVIMHLTAPILTAVYLYVFHAPGMVKCFGFALGLQNLAGVFTHLLVPMASPWFTHMYGIDDTEHVSYTQEGYAAGLTRVDNHLGTHLNTNGFHLSPIVFGAVPSLHSAIAFQCFLFLCFRASGLKHTFAKKANNGEDDTQGILRQSLKSHTASSSSLEFDIDDEEDDFDEEDEEDEIRGSDDTSHKSASSINNNSASTNSNISSNSSNVEEFQLQDMNELQAPDLELQGDNKPLHFVGNYVEDTSLTNKWYLKPVTTGILPPLLASLFISVQWWTTMYLDHHWRFDLFVGEFYALISYTIINRFFIQPRVLKEWYDLRRGVKFDTRNEARTMGMRVFQGTNWEWFFDPLA